MTAKTLDYLAISTSLTNMPALSIRQPWPHHIFHDGKDVENRTWRARTRGWIMIHAGKSTAEDPETIAEKQLPLGGIVGFARITDCVERSESQWFHGPFAFVLADAFPVDLVECRGEQGFFRPPADVLHPLAQQLHALAIKHPVQIDASRF